MARKGNLLTAIFRVTPENRPQDAVYFSQNWKIPPMILENRGEAELRGTFRLGEGTYQVDWLLRDREERFCSARWRVAARRHGKDRQVELRLPPGTAEPELKDLFTPESPVPRNSEHPLRALVLLHVAPRLATATALPTSETEALISILRSVAREPLLGSYSIAAFNLGKREVLFRQNDVPQIDFPGLGDALARMNLGTIEVKKLLERDTEAHFLSALISEQTAGNPPDALIFIGPHTTIDLVTREGSVKELIAPSYPTFYLSYNPDPTGNPWRDLIGSAIKLWKGFEYTIERPRDVQAAWSQVMARLSSRASSIGISGRSTAINGLVPKK
jgi:hypothetical protein